MSYAVRHEEMDNFTSEALPLETEIMCISLYHVYKQMSYYCYDAYANVYMYLFFCYYHSCVKTIRLKTISI